MDKTICSRCKENTYCLSEIDDKPVCETCLTDEELDHRFAVAHQLATGHEPDFANENGCSCIIEETVN